MPPLVHLLAPQIMARAREFEEALGPPGAGYLTQPVWEKDAAPLPSGVQKDFGDRPASEPKEKPKAAPYLTREQSVGYEKTPYDPRGVVNKPEENKVFDPRTPEGATGAMLGYLQRSGDPRLQDAARAFIAGQQGMINTEHTAQGHVTPQILPNVPTGPGHGEQIGMTERGEPIYASLEKPTSKVLKLKRGEAAGFNEKGESVDPKGKKLGYLSGASAGMHDLARRKEDNVISKRTGELTNTDAFGASSVEQLYGKHHEAMQEHFNDTGKEAFPPGYFDGMSATEKQAIKDGVRALQALKRGQKT